MQSILKNLIKLNFKKLKKTITFIGNNFLYKIQT